jgi:hypothetical protein
MRIQIARDVLYRTILILFFRGASYIKTSKSKEGLADKFVSEKAPRTAVVVQKNGTLNLMQVSRHSIGVWQELMGMIYRKEELVLNAVEPLR